MENPTLGQVESILNEKYRRGEAWFRCGQMRNAVEDLYSEDVYYLSPNLTLLRGREPLIAFFESVKTHIAEVSVSPVVTWGDPERVVYQLCNTRRLSPQGGAASLAHYIAAFRRVGEDWLCEMEVPAAGAISV